MVFDPMILFLAQECLIGDMSRVERIPFGSSSNLLVRSTSTQILKESL